MNRTDYLTTQNRTAKIREWLVDSSRYRRPEPLTLDTQLTALLLLDLQDVFLNEASHAFVPSAPFILPELLKLSRLCHNVGLPVIATQHINTTENAGRMKSWWKDVITENHPYAALVEGVNAAADVIITKSQYDAFYQTLIAEELARRMIDTVIITGVMTHLCCETTARSAFVRGLEVVFPVNGTATYNEELHVGSLRALAHGVAQLSSVEDIQHTIMAKL